MPGGKQNIMLVTIRDMTYWKELEKEKHLS